MFECLAVCGIAGPPPSASPSPSPPAGPSPSILPRGMASACSAQSVMIDHEFVLTCQQRPLITGKFQPCLSYMQGGTPLSQFASEMKSTALALHRVSHWSSPSLQTDRCSVLLACYIPHADCSRLVDVRICLAFQPNLKSGSAGWAILIASKNMFATCAACA